LAETKTGKISGQTDGIKYSERGKEGNGKETKTHPAPSCHFCFGTRYPACRIIGSTFVSFVQKAAPDLSGFHFRILLLVIYSGIAAGTSAIQKAGL
jgi:hypothetical protein